VSDGSNVFTYSYLANSPLVETIVANNGTADVMTTTKAYDKLNRLLSISAVPAAGAAAGYSYQYNKANQRTKATLADGSYWVYGYDALGQVISGVKRFADGTVVPGMTFGYDFDDIGNRQTTDAGGQDNVGSGLRTATYSSNLLNQYTQRTVPGIIDVMGTAQADATVTVNEQPVTRKDEFFYATLDVDNAAASVLTDVKVTGVRAGVGAGGEDAVTEETGQRFVPKTPEMFTYDLDGNTLSDGRWSYTWNGENRLIVAESPETKLEFAYDHQGRRFSKKTYSRDGQDWALAEERLFIYDNWNLVCEVVVDNAQLIVDKTHLWGLDLSGSEQGAGGVGGLLASTLAQPSATRLVAYDGNGNVVALIDATSAEEVGEYQYSPFGQTLIKTGDAADDNVYRFSTKYLDEPTGYYYYGHRYYSPELGRWMSRDPIGEVGHEARDTAVTPPSGHWPHVLGAASSGPMSVPTQGEVSAAETGGSGVRMLYAMVTNDPVRQWDLLGEKHQSLVSILPLPGHAAIKIDGCHCKGIFSFAPSSLVPLPTGFWPGEVQYESLSSPLHVYGAIGDEITNDCYEKFLCDTILASKASPREFHFSYYNCWSWVWDVYSDALFGYVPAKRGKECCKYECP